MNKHAFLEGYTNKEQLREKLTEFVSDPKLRMLSYLPEASGVAGASVGALAGHKLSKSPDDSEREKRRPEVGKILAGSAIGGGLGAFAGNTIQNRIKWAKIRKVLEEL